MDFKLVAPTVEYKASFLEGLREFQAEGLAWHLGHPFDQIESGFEEFVAMERAKVSRRTDSLVPETELWAIVDGMYAGRIAIRHELNDVLKIVGGHVGYDTRATFRGRGIATRMLAEALPIARALGLKRVLLTCDDTNIASIRVIEKNGGVLEAKRSIDPASPPKRYYWITT